MAGTVTQLGGDRTEMLALLDRVRGLVASGNVDGVVVLWDTADGSESDSAGVWDAVSLLLELDCLRVGQESAWRRAVEAGMADLQ